MGETAPTWALLGALAVPAPGAPAPAVHESDPHPPTTEALCTPSPSARPTVVFALFADVPAHQSESTLASLRAYLGDTGVELVVEQVEGGRDIHEQILWATRRARCHGALGVFWADVARRDDILLYLVEPEGLRALVRRIPREADETTASLEALGIIVRSTTTALRAGATIGMVPVDLPAPAPLPPPKPAPPPVPVRELRIRGSLEYSGNSFADTIAWQNGVLARFEGRPHPALVLGIATGYVFPSYVHHPLASVSLQRIPIVARIGYYGAVSRRVAVEFAATAAIDVTLRRTTSSILPSAPASVRPIPTIGAEARASFPLLRRVSVFALLGLDVVLDRFTYVVAGDEPTPLVDAHRVRARAAAGIAFGFP